MAQILATNGSIVEATLAANRPKQAHGTPPKPAVGPIFGPAASHVTDQTSGQPVEPPAWQTALKRAIRSGRELCQALNLPPELASPGAEVDFPATFGIARRICPAI